MDKWNSILAHAVSLTAKRGAVRSDRMSVVNLEMPLVAPRDDSKPYFASQVCSRIPSRIMSPTTAARPSNHSAFFLLEGQQYYCRPHKGDSIRLSYVA